MKRIIRFFCIISILMAVSSSAQAHERRLIGPNGEYRLTVGFANEPAAEDEPNQMDLFLLHNDGSEDGEAVSMRDGDLVDIDFVKVLLLKEDAHDAKILRKAKLKGEFRQRFGSANRYNIDFRPTADGAYGFWVKGRVQELAPNEDGDPGSGEPGPLVEFEELYVCGGGSLDIDPETDQVRSRFSCVGDLQPFPSRRIERKTGLDFSSHRDTDKFSLPEE